MTDKIKFIGDELNTIRGVYHNKKYISTSLIAYYNQIEQPKEIHLTRPVRAMEVDDKFYFQGYWIHLNEPFSYWNGFYVRHESIIGLLSALKEERLFYKNNVITDFNDLTEHIIAFREGFLIGYKNFDTDKISAVSMFDTEENKMRRLVDFVSTNKASGFTYTAVTSYDYPQMNEPKYYPYGLDVLPDDPNKWRRNGIKNGNIYKAWLIILTHYRTFDKFFETDLKQAQPIQIKDNIAKSILTIRKEVENAFAFMQDNDPRKHELILNETDFDNLINWVTYYFENNFTLPEIKQPIQEVNTNKGNVIYTFMNFFKYKHPTKTRPESLFELIKACFFEFRNDKIENLKKTSKPQFYNDLVSKNK